MLVTVCRSNSVSFSIRFCGIETGYSDFGGILLIWKEDSGKTLWDYSQDETKLYQIKGKFRRNCIRLKSVNAAFRQNFVGLISGSEKSLSEFCLMNFFLNVVGLNLGACSGTQDNSDESRKAFCQIKDFIFFVVGLTPISGQILSSVSVGQICHNVFYIIYIHFNFSKTSLISHHMWRKYANLSSHLHDNLLS